MSKFFFIGAAASSTILTGCVGKASEENLQNDLRKCLNKIPSKPTDAECDQGQMCVINAFYNNRKACGALGNLNLGCLADLNKKLNDMQPLFDAKCTPDSEEFTQGGSAFGDQQLRGYGTNSTNSTNAN